jgi:hypothetical protein
MAPIARPDERSPDAGASRVVERGEARKSLPSKSDCWDLLCLRTDRLTPNGEELDSSALGEARAAPERDNGTMR